MKEKKDKYPPALNNTWSYKRNSFVKQILTNINNKKDDDDDDVVSFIFVI